MAPSLVIVGSGIQSGSDVTLVAREEMRRAEKLLYLVAEPVTATWLHELNSSAQSLHSFYAHDKSRGTTYAEVVEHVLSHLRAGRRVCVVNYGHPGVFSDAMHEAMRRARAEHFEAVMLPGISAIDWLYADLGVDPGAGGCQIYDATAFLAKRHKPQTDSSLVLLQVGLIGEKTLPRRCNAKNFGRLIVRLAKVYGGNHQVILYEASRFRVAHPRIERMALKQAARAQLSFGSTLYVPPKTSPTKKFTSTRNTVAHKSGTSEHREMVVQARRRS